MNLGLRCGQLLAERADIKRMNIIERRRLWYRLERIGQTEEPPRVTPLAEIKGISYRQLKDDIEQLKARLIHQEKKFNEFLDKKRRKSKYA